MIHLLVTADDFGSGPGRNAGILAAFRHGLVTGASLLATGPALAEAVELARAHNLPVGVHLNLSEGIPLSGPIAGLTDAGGAFPGKAGLRNILAAGNFDTAAAQRELDAQVERVRSAGLVPTHLDSHQHFALFPTATPLLIAAARTAGIGAVRLPLPQEPATADPDGPFGQELALYRRLAPDCAAALAASGLATPAGLYGMPLLDRLDETALLDLFSSLPSGTWELMTHPGETDPNDPFGGAPRMAERDALCSPEVRALATARDIRLISFREVACAS